MFELASVLKEVEFKMSSKLKSGANNSSLVSEPYRNDEGG